MSERTWGEIEREIREDYLRADGPESVEFRQVQWDVWLAEYTRVKQAEAWDEGFVLATRNSPTQPHPLLSRNPYRKGESDDQPA